MVLQFIYDGEKNKDSIRQILGRANMGEPFLIGLFYSKEGGKPDPVEEYLEDLVNELTSFKDQKILIKGCL